VGKKVMTLLPLKSHIFKTLEQISMIWHTSTLFYSAPFVGAIVVKFIIRSGGTWRKKTWILLSVNAKESSAEDV